MNNLAGLVLLQDQGAMHVSKKGFKFHFCGLFGKAGICLWCMFKGDTNKSLQAVGRELSRVPGSMWLRDEGHDHIPGVAPAESFPVHLGRFGWDSESDLAFAIL